jgi:putative addiction module killer protein
MEARPRKLAIYETATGNSPFAEWLQGLRDRGARARIRVRIDRASLGNLGDCKPVGAGVLELRIDYGPGYRVYLAEDGPALMLLLCGGDKSSQSRDVELAQEYWRDYRRR